MSQNKFTIQKSFAISASAGSGKTYTLSRRFLNILLGFDFFIESYEQEHFYADREAKKTNENVWLTLKLIAEFFGKGRRAIAEHLKIPTEKKKQL